jgi:hypothetical protein
MQPIRPRFRTTSEISHVLQAFSAIHQRGMVTAAYQLVVMDKLLMIRQKKF